MAYQTSIAGILEIFEHEGLVPGPYLDSQGIWTAYLGHTAAAGDFDPADMPRGMPDPKNLDAVIEEAIRVFQVDIRKYEARVNRAIKVPLKQWEYDTLVSFDYNTGGIFDAKLTTAINSGDPEAAKHFMGWLKPPEIRKRRMAEMKLFETGSYDANGDTILIWNVDERGKLRGIHSTVSGKDLLRKYKQLDRDAGIRRPTGGKPSTSKLWAILLDILEALFDRKGAKS